MLTRPTVAALGLVAAALLAAPAAAQTRNPCADHPCNVVFDWGNGSTSPDPDRHFGAPSELEAKFVEGLQAAGMRVASAGQEAPTTITVRLTPQNRVICDSMSGTNSDYSCHTVQRAAVVFATTDASIKVPGRVDVSPRCSDPVLHPTYAGFGQYAAETVIYTVLNDQKGERPRVKCI